MNTSSRFLHHKDYKKYIFYQKTVCLYDITFFFTGKYLARGDRTVDQMVQAARSGKQNIIEGTEAAMTSTETEIKLNNVARASLKELLADYEDYLRVRNLPIWDASHPRYLKMRAFCYFHNNSEHYSSLFNRLNDEELANISITLIHQVDAALHKHLKMLEEEFTKNGGLREQMTQVRLQARNKGK